MSDQTTSQGRAAAATGAPVNLFKQRLLAKQPLIGLWAGLASSYGTEVCAGAGFDWLLLDAEHAPNDVRSVLAQLQAVAAYPTHAIVRPPIGETWIIKQLLDIGAQTLLVPMVETAEQAQKLVAATRYPPQGVRGVGSALARASGFNGRTAYAGTANDQICLLVQVETANALANLDAIVGTDGVDGVFIGPADLAASMGHLGNPGHPSVQAAIEGAISRILELGKAPGILTSDPSLAHAYLDLGAVFVAVGTDVTILASGTRALARRFSSDRQASAGIAVPAISTTY
jgi:4-hydroxy-2-oxoheptanedioate aldolase